MDIYFFLSVKKLFEGLEHNRTTTTGEIPEVYSWADDIYLSGKPRKKNIQQTVNNLEKPPPAPTEISSFWTPLPSKFLLSSAGGMDIFWNYTILWTQTYGVTIQMKPLQHAQYFNMILLI